MKPVPVAAILKELKKQQEDRDKEREEREKEREKEKEKENELALQNAQQTKSAFSGKATLKVILVAHLASKKVSVVWAEHLLARKKACLTYTALFTRGAGRDWP